MHYEVRAFGSFHNQLGVPAQFAELAPAEALAYGMSRMQLPAMTRIEVWSVDAGQETLAGAWAVTGAGR